VFPPGLNLQGKLEFARRFPSRGNQSGQPWKRIAGEGRRDLAGENPMTSWSGRRKARQVARRTDLGLSVFGMLGR